MNPFGYTGAYQFQDGTVHLSHRFYDTFTLGFTQPDPSRQELNNHTYAACDPINNTDPTGLSSVCTGMAIAGGVIGAIGLIGMFTAFAPATAIGTAVGAGIGWLGGATLQGAIIGYVAGPTIMAAAGNALSIAGVGCIL